VDGRSCESRACMEEDFHDDDDDDNAVAHPVFDAHTTHDVHEMVSTLRARHMRIKSKRHFQTILETS
jgi:hypothetical protein